MLCESLFDNIEGLTKGGDIIFQIILAVVTQLLLSITYLLIIIFTLPIKIYNKFTIYCISALYLTVN